MLTRILPSLIVCTSFTVAASAQRNAIDTKVRVAGDTQWHDFLDLHIPFSQTRTIEVAVFYERASGYGFAGALNDVVVSSWRPDLGDTVILHDRPDSTLHPDGRQGRFNFGVQAQAAYVYNNFPDRVHITDAQIGGFIYPRQNNPVASGSLFDTGAVVLGFRCDVVIGSRQAAQQAFFDFASLPYYFAVFQTDQSTTHTSINVNSVVHDPAGIQVIWTPSPSTVSILTAALLFRRRRRRSGQ